MEHLNRRFYANGENGYVSVKKEPGSRNEVAVIENGKICWIQFTYSHNGEDWGITKSYISADEISFGDGVWVTGWIPMSQLLLAYDYISFDSEYSHEYYTYDGSYEAVKEAEKIVFWAWPGSGLVTGSIIKEHLPPGIEEYFDESITYKDERGREWGFIGYAWGHRNAWVCLDNPENEEIEAFNPPPGPELWPSPSEDAPIKSGLPMPTLIIILVAALVIGTAILIRVFWIPNKESF